MSFLTVLEQDIQVVEKAVVSGAKTVLNYIDNVVVVDLIPELETALQNAIKALGQEAIALLLSSQTKAPSDAPASPPNSV